MNDSTWGRPLAVLLAPTETFRKIAARPTWLLALAIIVAIGLIGTWAVVDKIDFESAVREQMAERGQSEEQIEQAAGFMARFGTVFAYGGAAIVPWLVFPLIAALCFVLLRVLGAGELGFGGSLAVVTHGFMPQAVKGLLGVPIALSRSTVSSQELQGGGLVPSNLLAVVDVAELSDTLVPLFQTVDFFNVWTAFLLAIGFRQVAGVSKGKAWGTVIGLWLLWVAVRMGWAAVVQSLA